jgi:glutamate--cysteine ligase
LHTPRYDAMAQAFAAHGPHGRTMMCSTAALQVSLDAGVADRVPARWSALHALGPVLLALFANSDRYAGERTGWASTRMRSWLGMDPARTGPVPDDGDPASAWARYAMRAPVLCVRRDGRAWRGPTGMTFADWIGVAPGDPPTEADLDYHLTTLFPPVRPRGYVEVRYLDQQAPDDWLAPVATLAALFVDEPTIDAVRDLCAPVDGRWQDAARHGLADPQLAAAARAVAGLAARQLSRTGLPQGICAEVTESVDRRLAAETETSR